MAPKVKGGRVLSGEGEPKKDSGKSTEKKVGIATRSQKSAGPEKAPRIP